MSIIKININDTFKNFKNKEFLDLLVMGESKNKIAENLSITRQRVSQLLKEVGEVLFEAEPELKKACLEFDTYINLSELVEDKFINMVEMIFLRMNPKIVSAKKHGCLVDEKIKFYKQAPIKMFNNAKELVELNFRVLIKPINIYDFASALKLNKEKIKQFIYEVGNDYFFIYKEYVVINSKKYFLRFLLNFDMLPYIISLAEFHKYFNENYPEDCKRLKIDTMKNFYFHINSILSIKDKERIFVTLKKGGYEFRKYAEKNNIDAIIHYNSKKAKENSSSIDSKKLLLAMKKEGKSKQELAHALDKTLATVWYWCDEKDNRKVSKETIREIAKFLNVKPSEIMQKGKS